MFGTLLKRKTAPSAAPQSEKAAPLSDRQLILLSRAAERADHMLVPPDDDETSEHGEALALLRDRGLIERANDNDAGLFRVSAAGLALLGVTDDEPTPAPLPEPIQGNGTAAAGTRVRRARSLKAATLRTKLQPSGTSVSPTRKAALVTLLRKPEGATLLQITNAFGWLPHSARAALSGLRKAGHRIERKVGPEGKEAVYRIADQVAGDDAPSLDKETTAPSTDAA